MKYQIDQSIKIENTSKTTYVAISNGKQFVVSIKANEKRTLELVFRKLEKTMIFKTFTFSVLCAKVLEKIHTNSVTIDREYYGHEMNIKNYIVQLLRIANQSVPDIHFSLIGKNSSAHHCVYRAHIVKRSNCYVTYREVLKKYGQISQ
jgi:hypothetical protein